MSSIIEGEGGLYIASWEHLYLFPAGTGTPSGLPSQFFFRHPWILILFKHLYCDEHGLEGERKAAEKLGWTTSKLFAELQDCEILKPLRMRDHLASYVAKVGDAFEAQAELSIERALRSRYLNQNVLFYDIFNKWRIIFLQPFLETNCLTLYDWPITRYSRGLPSRTILADIIKLEIAALPLLGDLSKEAKNLFFKLQKIEKKPLRKLLLGQLSNDSYLEELRQYAENYKKIDTELSVDKTLNLERIYKIRNRFGAAGGWDLLQEYLKEYRDDPSLMQKLFDKQDEIQGLLKDTFVSELALESNKFGTVYFNSAKVSPVIEDAERETFSPIEAVIERRGNISSLQLPPSCIATTIRGLYDNYEETGSARPTVRGGVSYTQRGGMDKEVQNPMPPHDREQKGHRDLTRIKPSEEMWIKFTDREAFGRFCVSLRKDHLPFVLAGSQIIVLDQTRFAQLPAQSRKLLEELQSSGFVQVLPTAPAGKRYLPTEEEAEDILQRLAKEFG